ncbi:putative exonuclease GOR [Ditylenchus destructor]|uniref:Exonuclease GOR n=1 Tax=Ditylenchus destructor TaxID=166010 RepID=A0AAD4MQ11_9BILA|nr:putative exonuclease GOR [Ditylenchus destructor]
MTELQNFYDSLQQFVLTEAQLRINGYPLWDDSTKELVVVLLDRCYWYRLVDDDLLERICCRCRRTYTLTESGDQAADTKCVYHWRRDINFQYPCCNMGNKSIGQGKLFLN